MPTPRLLMPSAGRKVGLMRALGKYFTVFPCGLADEVSACRLACPERFTPLPPSTDRAFGPALLEAIRRHKIDAVLPVRNEDLEPLWLQLESIYEADARMVMSSIDTVRMCCDKMSMFLALTQAGFTVPGTCPLNVFLERLPCANWAPTFIKPRRGSGSRGTCKCESVADINEWLMADPAEFIIQPFIEGPEFTVDMFFDWEGRLKQAVARRRFSTLNGQIDSGEVVPESVAGKVLELGDHFNFCGPINVQFIVSPEGRNFITDINPRFSGGIPLSIAAGADFPAYLLEMVSGGEVQPRPVRVGTRGVSFTDYVYA